MAASVKYLRGERPIPVAVASRIQCGGDSEMEVEEERLDDGVKGRHLVPSQRTSLVQYLSCELV